MSDLEYARNYYGVSAVLGGRVTVDDILGVITGSDEAGRLLVQYEDGEVVSAHPIWRVEYLDGVA
jgi:biotin-(acetyl-CoA carboxylase) ligase